MRRVTEDVLRRRHVTILCIEIITSILLSITLSRPSSKFAVTFSKDCFSHMDSWTLRQANIFFLSLTKYLSNVNISLSL